MTQSSPQPVGRIRWLLIGIALLFAGFAILAAVGSWIDGGAQFAFDRAVLLMMREPGMPGVPEGPAFLKQAMLDITALGGGTVLTLVVVLSAGFLLIQRHVLTALLVVAGGAGGPLAVAILKPVFGRQRPEVIDHLIDIGSASFPSGHSANSAAVYLTLALVLVQIVRARREQVFILGAAILLVLAIGSSRIYLGVHWPSDVLAGWTFGALWALGWWAIGHWLRDRFASSRTIAVTPDRSA
ncbi:phosphatase PAP2 family protein [Novosphingopyxis sp. YJ-S2-01]|uniref:phosphatase PAP2 family protein n=1 Tax=Novosphingopyxis sp. YJ-S2-01 TaxID=2794021 RepID=UPI0018DCAA1D|nr:phosphatase PAP2 family protein [Novosphingopyxis sp. YJ-S2-01]MBH9536445.1 phosphatase PAP2 family protein [Novosphingopyxis sp. YJ-S2-01]